MLKLLRKFQEKRFYKKILKQIQNEIFIFNLRIYLTNIEIENIETFLKKIDNTKEQLDEANKLSEQKKNELQKDHADKINTQLRLRNIKKFINL